MLPALTPGRLLEHQLQAAVLGGASQQLHHFILLRTAPLLLRKRTDAVCMCVQCGRMIESMCNVQVLGSSACRQRNSKMQAARRARFGWQGVSVPAALHASLAPHLADGHHRRSNLLACNGQQHLPPVHKSSVFRSQAGQVRLQNVAGSWFGEGLQVGERGGRALGIAFCQTFCNQRRC
jgi:hypothetical protein